VIWSRKEFWKCRRLKIDTAQFFRYDTWCKNGVGSGLWTMRERDNDPAVQRSLSILFDFSIDMPTFKISKSKKRFFYQEGVNKALSDVMEHQISLRKYSKYNNINWVSYVDIGSKTQKIRSWFCEINIWWLRDRCIVKRINRLLSIFAIHFPSYTNHLSAVYTKQSFKHSNTENLSTGFHAQSKRSQRCV